MEQQDSQKLLALIELAKRASLKPLIDKINKQEPLSATELRLLSELEADLKGKQKKEEEETLPQVVFKNLREVTRYLRTEGWKVSQSTLYKHQGEGKIKAEPDGTYTLAPILRYARAFLVKVEVKQKLDDEDLQRRKTKAEIWKSEEQAKLAQLKRQVEEGRYVLREDFDGELAARTALFQTDLKYRFQAEAGDWVELVGGDHARTGDLIQAMTDALDRSLNAFASLKDYQVMFQPAEQAAKSEDL